MSIVDALMDVGEELLEGAAKKAVDSLAGLPDMTLEEATRGAVKLAFRHIMDEIAKKELGG